MKLLIAPRSHMPIFIKGIIRWAIVKWLTKVRNHRFYLYEYGEGCDVPGWQGWFEWQGMTICFVDTDGNDHYRW